MIGNLERRQDPDTHSRQALRTLGNTLHLRIHEGRQLFDISGVSVRLQRILFAENIHDDLIVHEIHTPFPSVCSDSSQSFLIAFQFTISQRQKTAVNASFSEADRCFCSSAQFGPKVFHDSAHHLTDGFVNLVIGQRLIVGLEM